MYGDLVLAWILWVKQAIGNLLQGEASNQGENVNLVAHIGNIIRCKGSRSGAAKFVQVTNDIAVDCQEDYIAIKAPENVNVPLAVSNTREVSLQIGEIAFRGCRHADSFGQYFTVHH